MRQLPFTRDGHPHKTFAGALLLWLLSLGVMAAATYHPYDDSSLTITSIGTPDPFISSFRGRYYMTFTAGNRVEIWSSSSLVDLEATAVKHNIWQPPPGTSHSADIWAPELHALGGRWYIYFAAADPRRRNESRRMYVLGGPAATKDPCAGEWEFLGPVRNMPDQWAIDGTVFELEGRLYLAYSGWPIAEDEDEEGDDDDEGGESDGKELRMARSTQKQQEHILSHIDGNNKHHANASDNSTSGGNMTTISTTKAKETKPQPDESGLTQHLYLVRLSDPLTADSRATAISRAQQTWEITRDNAGGQKGGGKGAAHAINEGPQWLASADGRWRGLAYSCAGSWTKDYKMATLRYLGGGAPLDPASWAKSRGPLLESDITAGTNTMGGNVSGNGEIAKKKKEAGHFGPGHGSFLDIGGGDVVAVYHATDGPYDGWENRRARVRRVVFTEMGPYMGRSFGVEGPVGKKKKREGVVARFKARLMRRGKEEEGSGSMGDGTEGLKVFLEARRLESEEAIGDDYV